MGSVDILPKPFRVGDAFLTKLFGRWHYIFTKLFIIFLYFKFLKVLYFKFPNELKILIKQIVLGIRNVIKMSCIGGGER